MGTGTTGSKGSGTAATPTDSPRVTPSLAIVLPDEPLPVRMMNTIWADQHGVHDAMATAEDLGAWLAAVASSEQFVPDTDDVALFRRLRDALRRLAAFVTDDTRPAAASATTAVNQAIADVNTAAGLAPTWPQLEFRDGEFIASAAGSATPTRRMLSSIADQATEFLTGEHRHLLRACNAPRCVLYFAKDHPRREWCSTGCGNRARAARHYQRHRKGATGG